MKFRKKPIVIEAVQWTDTPSLAEIYELAKAGAGGREVVQDDDYLSIATLEGLMIANPGDWIIKGVQGELYPCKPDIFKATYEPVDG